MKITASFTFDIEVKKYVPARPAPPCSNPSSPRYSDPGDDEELEYDVFLNGNKIEDGAIIEEVYEDVAEVVRNGYEI